jgi:2-polyprenyl-6-methoxyphenol hydroxylase-like FAD-dependent oxidoreductase
MYDVIIVGARVAGSATALLLARKGYKVLVVDKATFPSDTMSTHQLQVPAVARLKRWGLLDNLIAANTPPARHVRFDNGIAVLEGSFSEFQGIDAPYCPRRTILDKLLVDAARTAGAEVRENFRVEDVLFEDERVLGIRGREQGGASVSEKARLVIGADGKHSIVAKAMQPETYHEIPPLSMGYYTYWDGVPLEGGEMYGRGRHLIGAWPTNDGLVITYIAWPIEEFHTFRSDIEGNFLKTLDLTGNLGERIRAGKRAERFVGTADLPNYFRKPYGPGWALVGDAGLVKDPITGQGIGDAFRDAELLVEAIDAGGSGAHPLDEALAGYQRKRDELELPMYQFTTQLASFAPPQVEEQVLFTALQHNQLATNQFFDMLTGTVPLPEFFAPKNLFKIVGARGMLKIMAHNALKPKSKSAQPQATPSRATAG